MRTALLLCAILFSTTSAHAGLVGLYKFNDSTNLGLDSSGNGNDATNFGAGFTASGYQNGGASFNGGNFLSVPIDVNVGVLPNMTWGAWANPTSISSISSMTVLSADNGGFDRHLNIDSRGDTSSKWSAFSGSTSNVVSSGVSPALSQWVFLAVAYDNAANSATLYVDNVSVPFSTGFNNFHSYFDIGRNPSYFELFDGTIDNVFVYDETLSDDQIADIRANGFDSVAAVPEPSSLALLGLSGLGLIAARKRRRQAV